MTGLLPLESEIKIGEHDQVTWHGMTPSTWTPSTPRSWPVPSC